MYHVLRDQLSFSLPPHATLTCVLFFSSLFIHISERLTLQCQSYTYAFALFINTNHTLDRWRCLSIALCLVLSHCPSSTFDQFAGARIFFLQHFVNKLPSNKIFKIYLTHRDLHLQIATGVSTLSSLSGRSAVTIDVPPDSSRFFGRKSSILHVVPVSHDITESAWSTFDVNRFFTPCNLCSFSLVKLYCRFYGISIYGAVPLVFADWGDCGTWNSLRQLNETGLK